MNRRRLASALLAGATLLPAALPSPAAAAPAPIIQIFADPPMVNPTGAGRYDATTLRLDSTEFTMEQSLTLQIEDPAGKVVRSIPMTSAGDADPHTYTVVVEPKDAAGRPLRDGEYRLRVMWRGESYVHTALTVDSVAPQITLAQASPNPFGLSTQIQAQFSEYGWYFIDITDAAGRPIARFEGAGTGAQEFWDGRTAKGEQVPDGTYSVEITVLDRGGNEARSSELQLRRKQAVLVKDVAISRKVIAPGHPEQGTAVIAATVGERVTYRWDLFDFAGRSLRSVGGGAGPATPVRILFDGKDSQGQVLPTGSFTWKLVITDDFGNTYTGVGDLTIDSAGPAATMGETPVVTLKEILYLPYRAIDQSGVKVSVERVLDGGAATTLPMDATGTELAIPLLVGTQTISISAVDGAGNTSVRSFVITRLAEPTLGVFVGGRPVVSDVAPEIVASRTVLPLRAVAEALGFQIEWAAESRTITMVKGDKTVVMAVGSLTAKVNGAEKTLEVAPFIKDERTMVPVRFISEGLGFAIEWDADTRSVIIK